MAKHNSSLHEILVVVNTVTLIVVLVLCAILVNQTSPSSSEPFEVTAGDFNPFKSGQGEQAHNVSTKNKLVPPQDPHSGNKMTNHNKIRAPRTVTRRGSEHINRTRRAEKNFNRNINSNPSGKTGNYNEEPSFTEVNTNNYV